MKIKYALTLLFLLCSTPLMAVSVGEKFPSVQIQGNSGLLDVQGKVTVVNFWATWCAACKIEIVEMNEKFSGFSGNKKFNPAFVSVDKEPKNAEKWVRANVKNPSDVLAHLYVDPQFKAAETLDLSAFPMTFVIDQKGIVRHIQSGYVAGQPSTDEIVAVVKTLL
jgi:peroxiredoxin